MRWPDPQENRIPITVNVGNATNLLVLRRLIKNRGILGPWVPRGIADSEAKRCILELILYAVNRDC